MRTRVDKRRSGKIADRKTRREEKREKEREIENERGSGNHFRLGLCFIRKEGEKRRGLVAPRRPSRCQSDREIGEIV